MINQLIHLLLILYTVNEMNVSGIYLDVDNMGFKDRRGSKQQKELIWYSKEKNYIHVDI